MTSTETPQVQHLSATEAENPALISQLTDLINEVYRLAEDGLWADSFPRTNVDEVTDLVRAEEFAVTRLGDQIVGCVRIQSLDAETGEFGMLAADPGRRGVGLGRELVRYAEQFARDRGHTRMQLELLVPREWTHPSKEFLAGWYGRLGYVVTGKGSIEEAYPTLAPHLATGCDFLIWHKDLALGR